MKGNYIYKRIGKQISASRKKQGISQQALSRMACLQKEHIAHVEKECILPSLHTLIVFAKKMTVNPW